MCERFSVFENITCVCAEEAGNLLEISVETFRSEVLPIAKNIPKGARTVTSAIEVTLYVINSTNLKTNSFFQNSISLHGAHI